MGSSFTGMRTCGGVENEEKNRKWAGTSLQIDRIKGCGSVIFFFLLIVVCLVLYFLLVPLESDRKGETKGDVGRVNKRQGSGGSVSVCVGEAESTQIRVMCVLVLLQNRPIVGKMRLLEAEKKRRGILAHDVQKQCASEDATKK